MDFGSGLAAFGGERGGVPTGDTHQGLTPPPLAHESDTEMSTQIDSFIYPSFLMHAGTVDFDG